MPSFSKWDREAYVERVGGPEEAERRHRFLMVRVDAHQSAEIRKACGLTRADVAAAMSVSKVTM
jgi:hypothetical protein